MQMGYDHLISVLITFANLALSLKHQKTRLF